MSEVSDRERIEEAAEGLPDAPSYTHAAGLVSEVLRRADNADQANGIVRVDTHDDATVEQAARALCAAQFPSVMPEYAWGVQREDGRDVYRHEVRAVLAALTGTDSEVGK